MRQWRADMPLQQGRKRKPQVLPPYLSQKLCDWIYDHPKSIWEEELFLDAGTKKPTGHIVGMTKHFRSSFSPLFKSLFNEMFVRGLARPNGFQHDVRIRDGTMVISDANTTVPVDISNTTTTIITLKDIVDEVIQSQLPEGVKLPKVISCFLDLCCFAIQIHDFAWMRDVLYLILNNPIIFEDYNSMIFLIKAYNISRIQYKHLKISDIIDMSALDGYIEKLDWSTPLFSVVFPDFSPDQPLKVPDQYKNGLSSLLFYMNVKDEIDQNSGHGKMSLHDIFDLFVAKLSEVVPVTFYAMSVTLSDDSVFFAKTKWKKYHTLLEEPPNLRGLDY